MNDQHDKHIPTVIADTSGEPAAGDYLSPPQLNVSGMPLTRSIPILLLIITLFVNGLEFHSFIILILQIFAIFRSHKWPTPALWLALAVVLAGFFIGF
jgi:hypothetical protein